METQEKKKNWQRLPNLWWSDTTYCKTIYIHLPSFNEDHLHQFHFFSQTFKLFCFPRFELCPPLPPCLCVLQTVEWLCKHCNTFIHVCMGTSEKESKKNRAEAKERSLWYSVIQERKSEEERLDHFVLSPSSRRHFTSMSGLSQICTSIQLSWSPPHFNLNPLSSLQIAFGFTFDSQSVVGAIKDAPAHYQWLIATNNNYFTKC